MTKSINLRLIFMLITFLLAGFAIGYEQGAKDAKDFVLKQGSK